MADLTKPRIAQQLPLLSTAEESVNRNEAASGYHLGWSTFKKRTLRERNYKYEEPHSEESRGGG